MNSWFWRENKFIFIKEKVCKIKEYAKVAG
jgi:hypothetical protein